VPGFWKPLGRSLSERYGDDYCAVAWRTIAALETPAPAAGPAWDGLADRTVLVDLADLPALTERYSSLCQNYNMAVFTRQARYGRFVPAGRFVAFRIEAFIERPRTAGWADLVEANMAAAVDLLPADAWPLFWSAYAAMVRQHHTGPLASTDGSRA